jgi:hypothetical protein
MLICFGKVWTFRQWRDPGLRHAVQTVDRGVRLKYGAWANLIIPQVDDHGIHCANIVNLFMQWGFSYVEESFCWLSCIQTVQRNSQRYESYWTFHLSIVSITSSGSRGVVAYIWCQQVEINTPMWLLDQDSVTVPSYREWIAAKKTWRAINIYWK